MSHLKRIAITTRSKNTAICEKVTDRQFFNTKGRNYFITKSDRLHYEVRHSSCSEAVARALENFANSQKNTSAGVSYLIKLHEGLKRVLRKVIPVNFAKFSRTPTLQTTFNL